MRRSVLFIVHTYWTRFALLALLLQGAFVVQAQPKWLDRWQHALEDARLLHIRALGRAGDAEAIQALSGYLHSSKYSYQDAALKQLAIQQANLAAPALLDFISPRRPLQPEDMIATGWHYEDGFKVKALRAVADMRYPPAKRALEPLLSAKGRNSFRESVRALHLLGFQDFEPYFIAQLDSGRLYQMEHMAPVVADLKMPALRDRLLDFLRQWDKSDPDPMYRLLAKSDGLASWDCPEIRQFVLQEFENVLALSSDPISLGMGEIYEPRKTWGICHLQLLAQLKLPAQRRGAYDLLYPYTGFYSGYREQPELFVRRKALEDSLAQEALNVLKNLPVDSVFANVILDSTAGQRHHIKDFWIEIDLPAEADEYPYRQTLGGTGLLYDHTYFIWADNSSQSYRHPWPEYLLDPLGTAVIHYLEQIQDEKDRVFLKNARRNGYFREHPSALYEREHYADLFREGY